MTPRWIVAGQDDGLVGHDRLLLQDHAGRWMSASVGRPDATPGRRPPDSPSNITMRREKAKSRARHLAGPAARRVGRPGDRGRTCRHTFGR